MTFRAPLPSVKVQEIGGLRPFAHRVCQVCAGHADGVYPGEVYHRAGFQGDVLYLDACV
jgi:dienelactone hydrolase